MLAMTDDAQTLPTPPDPATLEQRLYDAADGLPRFENSDEHWRLRQLIAEAAGEVARAHRMFAARDENHRELGQHIVAAHKPGEVDHEAVAILDGYHVGARAVAGGGQGEPGETTLQAALRLLKLAHARGAFAAAEHVVTSAAPPTGPTFRVAEIGSPEAIPEWAKAAFPDWALNGFSNDRTDERSCIAILRHGRVEFHWDGGEPEDNTYGRDWAWVHGAIVNAYKAGFDDARSGAVPTTWAEICDKIKALGLRCYIRGGEGVETALMIDGPAVYYAPEGIHKAPQGQRIADVYDHAVAAFLPRVVERNVVNHERLEAELMTVGISEYTRLLALTGAQVVAVARTP